MCTWEVGEFRAAVEGQDRPVVSSPRYPGIHSLQMSRSEWDEGGRFRQLGRDNMSAEKEAGKDKEYLGRHGRNRGSLFS